MSPTVEHIPKATKLSLLYNTVRAAALSGTNGFSFRSDLIWTEEPNVMGVVLNLTSVRTNDWTTMKLKLKIHCFDDCDKTGCSFSEPRCQISAAV